VAARKARFAATAIELGTRCRPLGARAARLRRAGGRLGSDHDAPWPISQGARVRRVLQEQLTGSVQAA